MEQERLNLDGENDSSIEYGILDGVSNMTDLFKELYGSLLL